MEMTFGDLTQSRIDVASFILALFSVFFTIVSAYIAALYFFLGASGLGLRLLAFFILTMSFLFLGGMAFTVSDLIEVIIAAWNRAEIPVTSPERLRGLLFLNGSNFIFYYVGALLGWAVAFIVYVALAYLTFGYRWRSGASS